MEARRYCHLVTMRTTALLLALLLASCSAFTAPKDPVTGIRQDAPPEWQGSPNPLDTPETYDRVPPSHGNFGPGWLYC